MANRAVIEVAVRVVRDDKVLVEAKRQLKPEWKPEPAESMRDLTVMTDREVKKAMSEIVIASASAALPDMFADVLTDLEFLSRDQRKVEELKDPETKDSPTD